MRLQTFVSTAFATALAAGAADAQSASRPPARFGLTFGVNSSTIGGSDVEGASRRTGVMGGAMLVLPLTPDAAIQPEVLYSMKGAGFDDSDGTGAVKMNYVEIPVLLRFEIPTTSGVKPFFNVGPAIAFRASCSFDVTASGQHLSLGCDDLESEGATFKTVDYGAVIGAGLAFNVSGKTMSVGARYDHSFSNIANSGDNKHRVFAVHVTLEFPWSK